MKALVKQSQKEIFEYCSKYFLPGNCTHCEDLCAIQNMTPCYTIWTDLSEHCCQTCDSYMAGCEFECTENSYNSSLLNVLGTSPSLVEADISSCDHNEKRINLYLYYVLVTLLPILGFIGKGTNR